MLEVKIFWNKNCFDLKISWNGDVIICNENLDKIVLWLESCKLLGGILDVKMNVSNMFFFWVNMGKLEDFL